MCFQNNFTFLLLSHNVLWCYSDFISWKWYKDYVFHHSKFWQSFKNACIIKIFSKIVIELSFSKNHLDSVLRKTKKIIFESFPFHFNNLRMKKTQFANRSSNCSNRIMIFLQFQVELIKGVRTFDGNCCTNISYFTVIKIASTGLNLLQSNLNRVHRTVNGH